MYPPRSNTTSDALRFGTLGDSLADILRGRDVTTGLLAFALGAAG
jgi:hypothetical protein